MQQQSWILLALVGAALIYEASGIDCVVCNDETATCVAGTKPAEACADGVTSCYVKITDNKYHRGCSTAAEEAACSDTDGTPCRKCTVNGCNSQVWRKCHKCATTDAACKEEQQAANTQFCTNFKANGNCYERFVNGKDVERGCEVDVTPATENVCNGNLQCVSCSDADGCNGHVSTAFQATHCVQCKSSDANDASVDCLKGTTAQTACQNNNGKCYSRILEGGVLERGCGSALSDAETTACTTATCSLCEAAGCNKEVFPADRLVCNQCETTDADKTCAEELTDETESAICKVYDANDKCYSRVTSTGVFERGCSSDLPAAEQGCAGLSDCLECTGANCNKLSEQKLKNRAKCQRCDSTDAACLAGTSAAENCDDIEDSCFVRINNGVLERNCLKKLSAADQTKCTSESDLSCVTCSEQNCNKHTWIKCHQCKESANAACSAEQADAASAAFCPSYKADDQCYERLESEKVVRGCASDLSAAACLNNLECRTCAENACNKEEASTLKTNQRCLQCTTASDSGGLCLAGTATSQPCKTESEQKCYHKVDSAGQLKRGCKGDLTDAEVTACTGDACAVCTGTECNTGIFPANRLKCYQCKSSADEKCVNELQGTDKSGYCKFYVTGDKCYSRDVDKIFERGCQSDLGLSEDACKDIDEKHCKSCDEADCNAISKERLNSAGTVALNLALMAVAMVMAVGCTL